jgi:hypothetical protein
MYPLFHLSNWSIFMQFGTNIMLLEATQISYILISYSQ